MADPPLGGQYPQYPHPSTPNPQGPVAPGAMPQPMRPTGVRRAVSLMYAGAVVGLVSGIVNGLTTHNVTFYTYHSSANSTTVHAASSVVAGLIGGIIIAGLWLWMAWKTGAGRNWARVLSSVFFGLMCLFFIGGIGTLSGGAAPAFIVSFAEWGVGLGALIHLWQRESGEFFAFAKQARLAARYGAPYPGYQPPGYGQAPQYSQPPYGQDSPPPPQQQG